MKSSTNLTQTFSEDAKKKKERSTNFNSFDEDSINLRQKLKSRKKRKLKPNFTHDHRCKNLNKISVK